MTESSGGPVTRIIRSIQAGDARAAEQLLPVVYDELRSLGRALMARIPPGNTLQGTSLVHEAYLRLVGSDVEPGDRAHFLALAATQMRRVLIDRARARNTTKRGGGAVLVSLDGSKVAAASTPAAEVLDLDRALTRLAEQDARKARVVEMHVFGGMTYDEIARGLDVSPATARLDMRIAKSWLRSELETDETDGP